MIGNNFVYCRPEGEEEAVECFRQFDRGGETPLYYGGGSEIITMCTAGSIAPPAVIDLKRIPALKAMGDSGSAVTFGAANTLEEIRISGRFPLLGQVGGRIADHTNQCRITLGGNLCGTILYREAVLPLLLADAELALYGPGGHRSVMIHAVFGKRMRLLPGELMVSAQVDKAIAQAPFAHIKRTFTEKIGYPAVTAAALRWQGTIRIAFSGICSFPFRSAQIEQVISNRALPPKARAEAALPLLPEPPRSSCEGSGAYRLHLLKIVLEEIIGMLEQ